MSIFIVITKSILETFLKKTLDAMFIQSFVYNPLILLITRKHFLEDFLVILKHLLLNYWKVLKKCFLCTTNIVMFLAGLKLQPYNNVLSVAK